MNQYQRAILENWDQIRGTKQGDYRPLKSQVNEFFTYTSKKSKKVLSSGFLCGEDCFVLTQEEDIFSTQYDFVLKANANIAACLYYLNDEWKEAERRGVNFVVLLDFENRVEQIKIVFADNLADDYVFTVRYVEADKELYYKKQEEKLKADRLSAAQIKHATGQDLVNIYFQPCCTDCEYTEIYLYIPHDYVTVEGQKRSSWQLIKKSKVSSEDFYKSISGLAYGTYAYVVKQFDKKGDLLLETKYIKFSLEDPTQSSVRRIVI